MRFSNMIAAFMPRHFGFCLSVGLELGGFKFKSSLNLEQVCKNKKLKKFHFLFFTCTSIRPKTAADPAPSPSSAWIQPWAIGGLLFLPPSSRTCLGPGGRRLAQAAVACPLHVVPFSPFSPTASWGPRVSRFFPLPSLPRQ